MLEWKDAEGAPRYACVVAPPGVETRAPLPLIVFFHDPEDNPSAVHKKTSLPKSAATFGLSGDPAHTGFVVLAPQGRHLHGGKRGSVFDSDYTGADNTDVATVDHFVAELDAKGLVDHRRVYTLGASYGGHMAATYAMMRANRVAAFAAYATDAPIAAWSCGGPPPPGLVIYRACDGFFSCESVERWLRARDAAGAETPWIRLGAGNEEEPSCATRNKCTPKRSEGNHHRWPKGREGDILAFFARHALGGFGIRRPPRGRRRRGRRHRPAGALTLDGAARPRGAYPAFCQSPMVLPSGSANHANCPVGSGTGPTIFLPPSRSTSASVATMLATST